jgi:hypothetical protein
MRIYPAKGLGVVLMANTTRFHHDEIIEAIVNTTW